MVWVVDCIFHPFLFFSLFSRSKMSSLHLQIIICMYVGINHEEEKLIKIVELPCFAGVICHMCTYICMDCIIRM